MTLPDWVFAHPWLTTIVALALIEAVAAPFRWQRRQRLHDEDGV